MLKVRENLKTNQDLAQRNIAIGANLQRVVNVIVDTHKQLKAFAAQREECRIFYDHYRLKLQDLEANARSQPDQGRDASNPLNAKLYRNQAKFTTAKQNFEGANRRADEMIQQIMEKSDQVLVNLSVKFTKEVQLQWYQEMQRVFSNMENIE